MASKFIYTAAVFAHSVDASFAKKRLQEMLFSCHGIHAQVIEFAHLRAPQMPTILAVGGSTPCIRDATNHLELLEART